MLLMKAYVEMEGIKGVWSLQQPPSGEGCNTGTGATFDKYLVQAYAWETRVLWIDEDDEMGECEIAGFDTGVTTLFCGNMVWQSEGGTKPTSFFVQATPQSVRLVDAVTGELLSEEKYNKKIMVAEGNSNQVVVALSGGELVYLELKVSGFDLSRSTKLVEVGRVQLDQDIACMSIRPEVAVSEAVDHSDISLMDVTSNETKVDESSVLHLRGKSSLLVVGFWTDNSVRLYALPTLVEVTRVSLGVDVQVRAVLLANLSNTASRESGDVEEVGEATMEKNDRTLHLLIGLGDGRVFTYIMTVGVSGDSDKATMGLPTLSDRREVQLGSRPISFSLFVHDQALCVFASCDRPTVIFSRSQHNAKLLFSPVNISADVSQMAPFHSQCFPHCLAMTSESGLLIGTIDSLQAIHVQSYHLNESPRYICFHEQTSTYVVCSSKTEMTARGESIQDRVLFLDDKTFTTRSMFELDANEIAMSCLSLVFDQPPSAPGTDTDSSVEYVAIGTAYVLPEEQEPTRGRMLIFEVRTLDAEDGQESGGDDCDEETLHLKRKVSLITEKVTKGGVCCMAALQGKLVAGIDAKVQVYQFHRTGVDGAGAPEMTVLCEHVGHIMSLFCKTSGDFVLVGDILRSITVLQLKTSTSPSGADVTSLKEVSRDFNSNYMRAVEVLCDDFFMGAEDNGNLFIVKRPGADCAPTGPGSVNLSEEEKSRLEMQSGFHMGDFINVFRRGMLGNNNTSVAAEASAGGFKSDSKKVDQAGDLSSEANATPFALFGTVSGNLGAVFTLSPETYHFLDVLEKSLNQVIRGLGGLSHEEYRQFAHCRRRGSKRRTIDGDLVEKFLDLPESQMRLVTKHLNDELHHLAVASAKDSKNSNTQAVLENEKKVVDAPSYTLDDVIQRLEELVRLH